MNFYHAQNYLLTNVLFELATTVEAYNCANEVAEQLLKLASEALESDIYKSPALVLIGTLIANSPSVVTLSTIEVINDVFTQQEFFIDLFIATNIGLVEIVLPTLEGNDKSIMQFVMSNVGILSKDSFLGEANSDSVECKNNALYVLDVVVNNDIEIEKQFCDTLYTIASDFSAIPLIVSLEVNQNAEYYEDLQGIQKYTIMPAYIMIIISDTEKLAEILTKLHLIHPLQFP